ASRAERERQDSTPPVRSGPAGDEPTTRRRPASPAVPPVTARGPLCRAHVSGRCPRRHRQVPVPRPDPDRV
ncbi:MAG: hypothetical protein AVDCRST_MAG48-1319, partial [uncultured Friedmanniella sp.]